MDHFIAPLRRDGLPGLRPAAATATSGMPFLPKTLLGLLALASIPAAGAEPKPYDSREHYTKYEYRIPMRDGARLFTVVYAPKDGSKTYPILMLRTPYSVGALHGDALHYGPDHQVAPPRHLGPSEDFDRAGYLFVFQDVRGRWQSEGKWLEMTPHRDAKKSPADVDESTDARDTIDWLLKNVPGHNGNVGLWGVSYPGFYVSASIIDSHPAIKAASPQAPVTDMYMNDDSYHGGAFMLAAGFGFYQFFLPQQTPVAMPYRRLEWDFGTKDGYEFFLRHGTLARLLELFPPDQRSTYADQVNHDTYDEYWKARNIAPRLKNIRCAVLTVGGWFDAEDVQGPLTTFRSVAQNNPTVPNALVMGPWAHGAWRERAGRRLGRVDFASDTAEFYRKEIVFPFFEHHLRGAADPKLARATVFESGTNVWRRYPEWPPAGAKPRTLWFQPGGGLAGESPAAADGAAAYDEYVSDPAKPVPFLGYTAIGVPQESMVTDERFAARRPDVLVYQTPPLEEDLTVAGPVSPRLWVSTSGTDGDWVVKLIDVYPPDFPEPAEPEKRDPVKEVAAPAEPMGGYQQLVRGGPLRAKFRRSFEKPEPMAPGKAEPIDFTLPDVNHTFRRGHRVMVQVQSSWFPLVDRNPQVFLRIPEAKPEDFRAATQRVYRAGAQASGITLSTLDSAAKAAGR